MFRFRPPPRPLRAGALLLGVALAWMACSPKPCTADAACAENEVCNTSTNRCEALAQAAKTSCSTDADCPAPLRCGGLTCRTAPPCMNISGVYDVFAAAADGGPLGGVRLSQAPGTCLVSTSALGAGLPVVTLDGTLNAGGSLTRRPPTNCDAEVAGDETLRVECGTAGSGTVYHYYATSADGGMPQDRFLPRHCGRGVPGPCNGRQCPAGGCGTPEPCPVNALGIPICTR